ncbi:hypothetical protein NECAME_12672 [Necator americanus]|uniref:Uncharacterized protein n=1 Tax=Necator americanus TaxID=51031 RepID=W2T0X7_NECAM|nr:hypothetical protein NECAME_12672 [Necator americanus]ETN74886.1 hypothetical protein NECAME_12672 [Necator americanus]
MNGQLQRLVTFDVNVNAGPGSLRKNSPAFRRLQLACPARRYQLIINDSAGTPRISDEKIPLAHCKRRYTRAGLWLCRE